jgi:hypothetical protein
MGRPAQVSIAAHTSTLAIRSRRYAIHVKDREVTVLLEQKESQRLTLPPTVPARGAFGLSTAGGEAQFMNLYARELALTTP